MAETNTATTPVPPQSAPRRPHPDLAAAMESYAIHRDYHLDRLNCMSGKVVDLYNFIAEQNKTRTSDTQSPNPPVGEQCIGLLQHSTDVQRTPKQLAERPEKSILAPYVALLSASNFPATFPNAQQLLDIHAQAVQTPGNQSQTKVVIGLQNPADGPNTPTRKFPISQGAALDAGYSSTVMRALQANTKPPLPAHSANDLYNVTESCFRNLPNVTIGQCFNVGEEQASLYLNQRGNTAAVAQPTSPTAANAAKAKTR